MRLASHLGMSLDRIKMETSASQFVLWMEYLRHEINHGFHRADYLAAILATEIRRSYFKDPNRVRPSDFPLPLKFNFEKKPQPEELDAQVRANVAKRFFFGLTGLIGSKQKGKR